LILRLNDKYKLVNLSEPLVCWRVSENSITMQRHTLQRVYADIAKEFAYERKKNKSDSYESINFNDKIDQMVNKYQGRYLCENGVYNLLFKRKHKDGFIDLFKGLSKGGFPYNSMMRGIVQIISKVE
jgi:hypothetical protein